MKENKIIIYSTTHCPYCVYAKDFFKQKGLQFEDYNVSEDREKAREMITKSGQMGVPVIDINGKVIVGFQPELFESLINN